MKNFTDYLLKDKIYNKKKIFINGQIKYSEIRKEIFYINQNFFSKFKKKLIGVSLNTSESFLLTYLSIIKSGNIAVLIEKGLSENRYLYICKKFKIDFFITEKKLEHNFFKELNYSKNQYSDYLTKKKINFYKLKTLKKIHKGIKDVAIVLFTSGSTGEKKGVMLTHQNLISNTASILKVLPIKKNDIVNLILPTTYSYGLSILNTHLKMGCNIYLHNSPFIGSVIKEIKKYKCTSFYGVPSSFELLINKTNFLQNKFNTLRYIAQAGGNLSKIFKEKLIDKFKNKVFIMYGATEASPRLSCVPPKMLNKKIDSIGRPLPGVKFKLMRRKKREFELAVKGKNIMKGYLNNNSLTQKKIRNNYFLTGDLAFKDSENFYYITKRRDKIIKRFGFKINLNQIENQIKNIKFVKYAKIFFNSSNELILLIQAPKKPKNIIREQVEFTFSKKFTTYEYPDKIIITYKNLNKFNKKISLEDIYNKFQNE
tara:strand:- start:146 stop:1594 length:1449 start_codon:yes stop_codon:yes gene_type:complete